MASWHSFPLEVTYEALGWFAFVSWSCCFYPQVILNFRRKSVVGLNFDFAVLNLTKHSAYLIYNAVLYFSPVVQEQYLEKFGLNQMIPVAANDVAFSVHAVLLTSITLIQIAIYDRGNQKISKFSIAIVITVWLTAAVCFFVALPIHAWLWLISVFNTIQVCMAAIKYTPQVRTASFEKSLIPFISIFRRRKCPVSSYEQVCEVFKKEVGETPDKVYEEFDPVPIASASLAQVHVARTHDGQKVAVKIQHMHMTDTAAADHATVDLIVKTLHWVFPSFDYRWLVDEMQESLPK